MELLLGLLVCLSSLAAAAVVKEDAVQALPPVHPDLSLPATPHADLDLLRNPDAAYGNHHYIKSAGRSEALDGLLRLPVVAVLPNLHGSGHSAFLLREGLQGAASPWFDSLLRSVTVRTALVFDPLADSELSRLPLSNLTALPECSAHDLVLTRSVPWLAFREASRPGSELGLPEIRGRRFRVVSYTEEDLDFFPEHTVFDLTRPVPLAFAPAPPLPPPSEEAPKP